MASRDSAFVEENTKLLAGAIILALLVALLSAGFTLAHDGWERSVGLVVTLGVLGLVAGAFVGFLFGLPKSAASAASPTTPKSGAASPVSQSLRTNTNLEEVSDWLTKIVIGVGLTQLLQIDGALLSLEKAVAAADPGGGSVVPLCAAVTVCACVIIGFLGMYLEARIVLSRILKSTEEVLADTLTSALAHISNAGEGGAQAMGPAANELKRAVELKPDDPDLRTAAVKALIVSGRAGDATSILDAAKSNTVGDRISKMFLDLYKPPNGYVETLKTAATLDADAIATSRADFWFYRAAALGQKLSAQLRATPPDGGAEETRNAINSAVRRCVALDASYKPRLYALAYPAAGSIDNDLIDMAGNAIFEEILK